MSEFQIIADEPTFVNRQHLSVYEDADGRLLVLCRHHVAIRRERGHLVYCRPVACADTCHDCKREKRN